MSKQFQSRLLIFVVIVLIVFMVISNIQLAMIIARIDKMEMKNAQTDYLVTKTYNNRII